MSTRAGVLLITHGTLGRLLLDCMREMFDEMPMDSAVLEVPQVQCPDALIEQGRRMIEEMLSAQRASGQCAAGVLLLTDAFGSTPGNIASRLSEEHGCPVVSGVNLPMLVRVFNYPTLDLHKLAEAALEGGRRGIALVEGRQT